MKTEQEIREYLEKLKKAYPKKVLNKADDGTRGWFQGMVEALKYVLDEDDEESIWYSRKGRYYPPKFIDKFFENKEKHEDIIKNLKTYGDMNDKTFI